MPQYLITTPEQVQFRYQIAGLTTRAMAWLLDQLILLGLRVILASLLAKAGSLGMAMILCLYFLLDFGYFTFFELYYAGQTPGKKRFGLRVIAASGARLRFADVMIRNLLRPLDSLPIGMLLGGTVAWLEKWHRRLGDMAAETLVIRDVRSQVPDMIHALQGRENTYASDKSIRTRILARIGRDERDLIFDLMQRREELEPAVRESLFAQTASYLRQRCQLPAGQSHLTDEQAVINVALVLENERNVGPRKSV